MAPLRFRVWHPESRRMYDHEGVVVRQTRLCELTEAIVMQSTGLFDKAGKEIFESDLVRLSARNDHGEMEVEEEACEVWFHNGCFKTRHHGFPVSSWACNDKCEIEVVGNMYERGLPPNQ